MSVVNDTVLTYLPSKRKQTPSGWLSFNATCCHHNGHAADTRGRGGLISNPDGGVSYHCFNCGFKASWQPGRGIVTLRNPSETIQTFGFTLKGVFELPEGSNGPMTATAIYPETRDVPGGVIEVSQLLEIELQPFETIVIEFDAIK